MGVPAAPGGASAAIIDNINGSFLPPFLLFGGSVDNIGWDYKPSMSYNLTGISTFFEPIGNPAPVRQGWFDARYANACVPGSFTGPGKVVLHQ